MFQQEVEELGSLIPETGAFIVTYVTSWWEVIGCLQIRAPTSQFIVICRAFCPHIVPGCAFQDCTIHLSAFCQYFKHGMLPYPQSVAKTGTW